MAAASGCTLEIDAAAVPLLPGVRALVNGNVPGGGRTNADYFGAGTRISDDVAGDLVQLLYDPQTSGGLLISLDPDTVEQALAFLQQEGVDAVRIGRATADQGHRVGVR
jgi:selenide,water dikinase